MSTILEDVIFESNGLMWSVFERTARHPFTTTSTSIGFPLCATKKCRVHLEFGSAQEITCFNCGRKYTIDKNVEELKVDVNKKYQASKLWDASVVNLDLLPTKIGARDEDENYWVQVKLGQKDGKRMAVVYIGEKDDTEGKKAQLFVDVDDEQMRFDKNDKHPMKVVTKLVAYFPNSTHTVEKQKMS
jgi:hypothetical protein